MKLCIGTVQFGVDYGLHGKSAPTLADSVAMLNAAVQHGVDAIDTSSLYGNAESVVGSFLRQSPVPRENLYIVSKFGLEGLSATDCVGQLERETDASMAKMGIEYLDSYICHVPSAVRDERIVQAMVSLRESGKICKVGFSVYEAKEAFAAIDTHAVDFLQIPLSILDQRMSVEGVLDRAAEAGVELHARSAFVQGLALMAESEVPEHLAAIRPVIARLDKLCRDFGIGRRDLAMAFVRKHRQISHLVFGVHDLNQLLENIDSFSADVPEEAIREARRLFADVDSRLVMPNKWRKAK